MNHFLQLGEAQSPKNVELNDQQNNQHSQQAEVPHFQFQGEENPFSFYNNDNQREPTSSDDEHRQQNHNHAQVAQIPTKHQASIVSQSQNIQIGDNLSKKAPIKEMQSIQQPLQLTTEASQNKKNDLDSLSLNQYKQACISISPSVQQKKSPNFKVETATSSGQKAYKQQLQKDMQYLKKNLGRKEGDKKTKIFQEKKQEKVNLNKTFSSIPRLNKKPEFNMQLEQMRMLVKMAFQKKKTNYQMLKEWDKKRAENMALHGKMIELLQNQVDTRIKSSLGNFQYYQTFFREKAKQEEKYAYSPIINTRYALKNNSLSKNVYINCSVILNSLCDENSQRCKKITDFVQLIRQNILNDLTQSHVNSSQKQLLKVREKISTLKSALKKQNVETQEKANELANLFNEQSNNITNKSEKDFYRTQLSFLRKALQQIQLQRKLGEYCLQYYHTAYQEEIKRSQVIREAMVTYSKGLKETYSIGLQFSEPEIQQLTKNQQVKLIREFYSLQEIFDQRTIQLFKISNKIPPNNDITIESLTVFINNFDYKPFDSRIILLKEFHVKNILKTKQSQQENCQLVITVDNFLHFFMNQTKERCGKPDFSIKIGNKFIQLKSGKDEVLQIIKREDRRASMMSYFWDNKIEKVFRVRFSKKDNKEEFIDYISKLMVDQF